MHFFSHTAADGRRYLLKLGRYVDMKREALITARLAACGSQSFAKTCGFYRMPVELQDDAGRWRRWNWRVGERYRLRVPLSLGHFEILNDDEGRLSECQDCQYHLLDPRGSYLKTNDIRAHIRLCPRECVVLQVQERIEGYTLEKFGQLFRAKYPAGYGSRAPGEKEKIQKMALQWLSEAERKQHIVTTCVTLI